MTARRLASGNGGLVMTSFGGAWEVGGQEVGAGSEGGGQALLVLVIGGGGAVDVAGHDEPEGRQVGDRCGSSALGRCICYSTRIC